MTLTEKVDRLLGDPVTEATAEDIVVSTCGVSNSVLGKAGEDLYSSGYRLQILPGNLAKIFPLPNADGTLNHILQWYKLKYVEV